MFSRCHNYDLLEVIERFSFDLKMKTREQNRNNKQMGIERFDGLSNRYKCMWLFVS